MSTSTSSEMEETQTQSLVQVTCKDSWTKSRRSALVRLRVLLVDTMLWIVISAGTESRLVSMLSALVTVRRAQIQSRPSKRDTKEERMTSS